MNTKTIVINEDIHSLIEEKRIELKKKGYKIKLWQATEFVIIAGLKTLKNDDEIQTKMIKEYIEYTIHPENIILFGEEKEKE